MARVLSESEEYLEYLEEEERPARSLSDGFLREPISVLQPANPVCADRATSVGDVVRQMQEHHIGCVLVVDGGKLVGVFTDETCSATSSVPAPTPSRRRWTGS